MRPGSLSKEQSEGSPAHLLRPCFVLCVCICVVKFSPDSILEITNIEITGTLNH